MPETTAETLWRQLSGDLRGFIRRRVPDEATAEDLLQDVFVRIHERLDQVGDEERIAAWVYRIARNRISDYYRARGPERASAGSLQEEAADPDAHDAAQSGAGVARDPNQILGAWLIGMVARLPEPYREAIELVEIQGLSQTAAAARLGISVSGAKSRVQRGRAKLRRMLHACCQVERDRRGNVLDFESRPRCC